MRSKEENAMDELCTWGREFFPQYCLKLWHNPHETLSGDLGVGQRYRLALVEQGSGIVEIGEVRGPFVAPVVICLDELDRVSVQTGEELHAQALYFHPDVINSCFTFDMARGDMDGVSLTEFQDLGYFQPFVKRSERHYGVIAVGPASARRMGALFRLIADQLNHQPDDVWPCRTRSFFLEAIFLLHRMYYEAERSHEAITEDPLAEHTTDVDPVILHLHTHYHEKITLHDLARDFHTNRTSLNERFQIATGLPVMTYLSQLRIRLAMLMLHDTLLSINEIAYRTGFNSSTHFGRMFRKTADCTPSEYRTRYCWMDE
jgi:AraC-like DNA-binding protein